ncbi:hypothetical protein ACHAQJ_008631 [Trichoderma viride]
MESDTPAASDKAASNEESHGGPHEERGQSPDDPEGHSVLLHLNESMLPGYDDEHIRQMGTTNSPGLRVYVSTGAGTAAAPLLIMKLQIKCGELWYPIAIVAMPLRETGIPLTAELLKVADTAMMKTMFTIPPTYVKPTTVVDPADARFDFDMVTFGPSGPQYRNIFPREATFIRPEAIQIIRITAVAKAGQLVVGYPPPFWRQIHRLPVATRTIATQIKSLFSSMSKDSQVSFWITFSFYPEWRRDWQMFFGDEHKSSPYGKVLWEQPQASDSADHMFRVLLLPFPSSEWTPADNDKQEYGIAATGLPTAYLMVVRAKEARKVLPDIGTLVEVYLQVAQGYLPLPQQPLNAVQIRKLAVEVQGAIKVAESKTRDAAAIAQARLDGLRSKDAVAKDMAHLISELFLETAAKGLMPYINKLSNKAKAKHPNGPEVEKRWEEALQAASQLRARNGENDNAHVKRITKWVKSQGVALRLPQPRERGEPFLGCRLSPPPSVPADIALFHIEAPRQPNWPRGFKQPPMGIAFPNSPPPPNVPKSRAQGSTEKGDINIDQVYGSVATQSIEVQCFSIRAMDNLDLDPTDGARLETLLRKVAGAITELD